MIGIYKITSPTGKIYIGQSWHIKKRFNYYSSCDCKGQPLLYKSLSKYGFKNHTTEIIVLLPYDTTQDVLDQYEIFVLNQYKEAGFSMLNLRDGGNGGKLSVESIAKLKAARKLQKPPTLGKTQSIETRKKISDAQKRNKKTSQCNIKKEPGFTANTRLKQRIAKLGNKINNKLVLNSNTDIFYDSLTDAANSINVTMKHLSYRITKYPQSIPFVYV